MMAIVLARWSADCARRSARKRGIAIAPGTSVIVFAARRGVRLVVACCARSSRRGVRRGMSLAHARSICPMPRMEFAHTPESDRALLRACAVWCRRYAPLTMIDCRPGPPTIIVDLTGCQRIYPDGGELSRRVTSELAARGFEARVASAPTMSAAVALAQDGRGSDICMCPLRTLRLPADVIEALSQVNVSTIGQLHALERRSIVARYGPQTLRQLDEALGQAQETFNPIRSTPLPTVQRNFDGPVTDLAGIRMTIGDLTESLCQQLRQRVRGGREFELVAFCADAPTHVHRVTLGAPSTLARHIAGMLELHVDRIPMGMGIESIRISVLRMGRSCGQEVAGQWIDTMVARLGSMSVLRAGFREDHRPAHAVRWIAVSRMGFRKEAALRDASAGVASAWRPSRILDQPEPVQVGSAHAGSITWRGRQHGIVHWNGPERITDGWAGATAPGSLDYWRVETSQGCWLWLCRRGDEWSVVGIWA